MQHIIGINGINNVAIKADLLDRSILIELERIPENKRMTEIKIKQEFENLKPSLLGACLGMASKATAIEPNVKINKLFRMADFTRWGYAIAEALGIGGDNFLRIYQKNISKQNVEAIDASPIALTVIELLKRRNGDIEGAPSYLLQCLNMLADEINYDLRKNEYWPKDERWLWRRLTEIAPNLEAIGIKLSRGKDSDRFIKIIDTNKHDAKL